MIVGADDDDVLHVIDSAEKAGVDVVAKALVEPLRWIADNAGLQGYVAVLIRMPER